MKKLHMIFFTALLCFAFASTAHAATSDLLNLFGNKEFWSSFNWGTFTKSELYKAAEWREPGWPGRSGVTVTNCHTIVISWPELNIEEMTVYEDSGVPTSDYDQKELKRIYAVSSRSAEAYQGLVNWCNQNFGEPKIKDLKSEETILQHSATTVKSVWTVGKTKISVTFQDRFFRSSHSFLTILQFEKNNEGSPGTQS